MAISLIISTNKPFKELGHLDGYIQKNKSINEVIIIGPRQKEKKFALKETNYKTIKSLKKTFCVLRYCN